MIKVSGEEYGIEENALPADAKEIQKQKQAIDDELKDIEAKQKSKKQPISLHERRLQLAESRK